MISESALDLIFRDLFYRLCNFAGTRDAFLKLQGFNVTGSTKVKTAIWLVEALDLAVGCSVLEVAIASNATITMPDFFSSSTRW